MKKAALLSLGFCLLFFTRCKKFEPANPCRDKTPVTAGFIIEQKVGERWFEGDTVVSCQFCKVRFRPKDSADTYLWKIGAETISKKTFEKTWLPENSIIPVTLIVKRNRTDNCFPNDDGIDTVTKMLYVLPDIYGDDGLAPSNPSISPYLPIHGTYYGESTFEPGVKKFVTLTDTLWTDEINRPARVGLIRGIPYKTLTTVSQRNASLSWYVKEYGATALYLYRDANTGGMQGYPTIPKMKGYAWLNPGNWKEITIEYGFEDTATKKWQQDVFKGTRVW